MHVDNSNLELYGRDWWLSPVTLLLEGKNCGMAEGCYGLNRADGSISVAALRPPCQGKAHRGPAPMTRRLAEFESQYCNNVLKNVKIPIKYKKNLELYEVYFIAVNTYVRSSPPF